MVPDDEWNWDLPQPSRSSDPQHADAAGTSDPDRSAGQRAPGDDATADSDTAEGAATDSGPSGDADQDDTQNDDQDANQSGNDQPSTAGSGAGASGAGPGMGRSVGYTVLGAILPGTGLIAARRRRLGTIILGVFAALVIGIGIWALADPSSLIDAAVDPTLLRGASVVLVVLGLAWVAVIIVSHLGLRRTPMTKPQRIGTNALVGVLCLLVAAPMAIAARYSYDQASFVATVFKSESHSHSATRPDSDGSKHTGKDQHKGKHEDPWAGTPRVNVLLLGGDAAADRTGNRTDTVIVASIDTKTGDTTLISLPRNTTRMPFPKNSPLHKYYPDGFTNGNGNDAEYFLNAMYDNVPDKVPDDVLGKTDSLGADAMKLSVGKAIGLKLDYYALINLKGFIQLIDALGGITVNINTYVAIGGDTDRHIRPDTYLKPGPHQHLKGRKALWFARGRYGADDFQRMDRQRCTMNAIIDQAKPSKVLSRYESIMKAGKKIVETDIPQEKLSDFVTLGNRVKDGHIRSLVFKNGKKDFHSSHPDFSLMHKQVKKSIGEAKKPPKKKTSNTPSHKKTTSTPSASASSSGSSSPSSSASSQSRSTKDACAWDPDKAAHARKPR